MRIKTRLQQWFRSMGLAQFYIISCWCIGIFLGLHIIPSYLFVESWIIHLQANQNFLLLLILSLLPIILTWLLIRFHLVQLLPLLCLLRAAVYGFSLAVIFFSFSGGAWLARILFLYTDTLNACLLLWFWLSSSNQSTARTQKNALIIALIAVFNCCIDHFILTPFLQKLF